MEAGKQGSREAGRQGSREAGKQGSREAGKQGSREAGKSEGSGEFKMQMNCQAPLYANNSKLLTQTTLWCLLLILDGCRNRPQRHNARVFKR
jgi:hypothetical protein